MAPVIESGDYEGNDPEPKLIWTKEELSEFYWLHSEQPVLRKMQSDSEHYFLHWLVALDRSQALVLYQKKGEDAFELLIDLKMTDLALQLPGFEGNNVVQVTGVDGHAAIKRGMQNQGFAQALYKLVARRLGVLIASDTNQYKPGAELWRALAGSDKVPAAIDVTIYNTSKQAFLKSCCDNGFQYKAGDPVIYDGENIPDEHIWGHDRGDVLLIAKHIES